MHTFNRSASLNRRALTIGSPRVGRPTVVSRHYHVPIVIGFLFTFLLAISASYIFVVPSLKHTFNGDTSSQSNVSMSLCDVSDGGWIQDDSYPLYNASECPFAEQGFNCLGNGRTDDQYLKWRWKPKNCDVPKFDVHAVLEWLRNRRLVFVGDSMSRSQWESLICLLMTGVEDKKTVYELNGSKITKRIRFLGVRFSSFNFTVEFFRSVFLVQHGWMPRYAPRRVRSTLKLDKLDDISSHWVDTDVLIFNTGQWWVPGKLFETGCYFQVGSSLKLGMSIPGAFRVALDTWASWVERTIDRKRTSVFFRTFEPSHWSDQRSRSCNVTQYPILEASRRDQHVFADIAEEVVKNMSFPITLLRITSLSAFRIDAHVGNWSDNPSLPDCSHWCLPGLPDMWNEILLYYILTNHESPL
ncbi:protein trichome berefringence-like 7 isoform X2 [Rhodamnia argentea]|uniref:Protein trichome berefringence-like 7 isoform X2 n=1 Tax=Rhodamnia argentea TaxID=178133 RepID=A0ABM3HYR1_9MYRT|nr:protein trichome berefringence-like 7 isoform X2 [Rhodamnia argentea]